MTMKKTPVTVSVGSLSEDMKNLAGKVYQTLMDGPRLVWADDDGRVYSGEPNDDVRVPPSWIAGTFAFGQPADDIEGDLLALRRERAKDWIID
jgi:hypothetical protein